MKSAVFASALALAGAEKVNLSYSDCGSGSTHGKITSLKPDSIDVPGKVSIVGSGALDSDLESAHFSLKVKKGIIPFVSGKGNLCEDTTINLPLGAGSFTVKGLNCPITAGNVDVEVDLDLLSEDLFDGENSLLTIHIDANADDTGDQVICLDVDASLAGDAKLESARLAVTGACTSDEKTTLADPQEVGDKANTCGTTAFNIITGKFNHDKFNDCFSSSIGISKACAECYAATGEYGAKNCKADCLLGWCKSGCLSCTAPAQETLATCTGFTAGTADPCEEELKTTGGACTNAEQSALADPQDVGDKANTCGTSSYNILTGKFNHDKFNSCFTDVMGISVQCAECYAATGEYGAKNCKADCLLGWCKSGCLSCTAPAQKTLATCTGFTAAAADPCETVTV